MGNAKSMSTGGASSAVGPALMRKAAPFRVAARDMMVAERTISKMQTVRAQFRQAVTFGREGK